MRIFPIVIQHDSMQCGIACLQMVCKYFGREYSSYSLSKLCFATTEGVSLPSILHWNQNHFVVLYKVKKEKKFYIADPGKGLVVYNLDEFKQHWISTKSKGEDKGIAMFLETTPAFFTYYKIQNEVNVKEKRSIANFSDKSSWGGLSVASCNLLYHSLLNPL